VLNGSSFVVGDTLRVQVQNFGTDYLFYGVAFWLERYEGGGWVPVDLRDFFGAENIGFILIGLALGPGAADKCSSRMIVPPTAQPGQYRIVKRFNDSRTEPLGITASAEFSIEPSS
jgi:Bacterial Ig-like domain